MAETQKNNIRLGLKKKIRALDIACSFAGTWADEILAVYPMGLAVRGENTVGYLLKSKNYHEKFEIIIGRRRGRAAIRAFERVWSAGPLLN